MKGGAIVGLDHVQLAMPAGKEDEARKFYVTLLGFTEQPKPVSLAVRGGLWLRAGTCELHLGVDPDFHAAAKAHPGFVVENLNALAERLRQAGCELRSDALIAGRRRLFTTDPFGNRIELIEFQETT